MWSAHTLALAAALGSVLVCVGLLAWLVFRKSEPHTTFRFVALFSSQETVDCTKLWLQWLVTAAHFVCCCPSQDQLGPKSALGKAEGETTAYDLSSRPQMHCSCSASAMGKGKAGEQGCCLSKRGESKRAHTRSQLTVPEGSRQ